MKVKLKITLFFIPIFNILQAQQLQTGIVQYPEYGIQFTIPEGWVGQELEESYAMQSKQGKGLMLLTLTPVRNMSDLKREFSKPITESGMILNPIETLKVYNDYVTRYYTGTIDGTKVKALGLGQLNRYGHSITMAVITEIDGFLDTHKTALFSLKNSLKLKQPKVNESFNAATCTRALGGKTLKHQKNAFSPGGVGGVSGSYSSTRIINLCPSGAFTYHGGSNVSVESENAHGHSGGTEDNQGNWEFKDEAGEVHLYLHYNNGESRYYVVTQGKKGGTYLDGIRYYRLDLNCN